MCAIQRENSCGGNPVNTRLLGVGFTEGSHATTAPYSYSRGCLFRFGRGLVRAIARAAFRLEVYGEEHLPHHIAVILAPNHGSYLDAPLLAAASRRPLRFLADAAVFRCRWAAPLLRAAGALPVDRTQPDTRAVRTVLGALRKGEAVVIFPEGGRRDAQGPVRARAGVATLARLSGAPVVPVGICGSHAAWPRGSRLPQPKPVHVEFGPSRWFPDGGPRSETMRSVRDAFTGALEDQICALRDSHRTRWSDGEHNGPGQRR